MAQPRPTEASRDRRRLELRARAVDLRDELAARNAERGGRIYLMVDERQACALAAGLVPKAVQAMARTAIDWEFAPRRKARGKGARV